MNNAAERIQSEMSELRGQLDDDVEEVVDSAQELADWRSYAKRYPWSCVGVAVTLGYLAVPRRVELKSPDVDTLLRLAKKNQLVVDANPAPEKQEGVASQALRFISQAAVRGALGYLGQKFSEMGTRQDDGTNASG